jgi:hypothetical protein
MTKTPTLISELELLELMQQIEECNKLITPAEKINSADFHTYYQDYQRTQNHSIFIPLSPFKQIVNTYNGFAMEAILNGKTFELGKQLGILLIKRINMAENGMVSIDWKATKELSAELQTTRLVPRIQNELYKLAWLSGKSRTAYYFTLYNFTMTKRQIMYAGQMVNPKQQLAKLVQDPVWASRYYKTKKYGKIEQYDLQDKHIATYASLKAMYAQCKFRIVNVLRAANFDHLTAYGYKWKVEIL